MKVRWLLRAVHDLEDIHEYISLDDPLAAGKEIEKILENVSLLGKNPSIGRGGRVKGTRELVISNSPYIAAYRYKNNMVEILRVIHGARKWPKRF
ncbi:MAG: type II toxin-antitoxin system RelE/ParE family toxin [bacterium]|nr:type II toxin-antitoxin system RelE/ParE family toxin [bacterium]